MRLGEQTSVRRFGTLQLVDTSSSLQRRKLIRYRRGKVSILDGRGLEAASCGCYAADKETYARVMG